MLGGHVAIPRNGWTAGLLELSGSGCIDVWGSVPWLCTSIKPTARRAERSLVKAKAAEGGNAIEGLRCASIKGEPDLAIVDVHDDPEVTAEECLGLGLIEATWAPSGVAARWASYSALHLEYGICLGRARC